MLQTTNNVELYRRKHSILTQTISIYRLYANLRRKTGFPFFIGALVVANIFNPQLQAIMLKTTNDFKLYHGKHSLFTETSFIYRLYANLQRTTGFSLFNRALVVLNIVNPQFQAIMRKTTNDVKLYHGKHSLFTETSFIYRLYANLQRTTGFSLFNGALVVVNIVNPQFQAIKRKMTINVRLYHEKHSLFTQTSFIYRLYANLQRTTGFSLFNRALLA